MLKFNMTLKNWFLLFTLIFLVALPFVATALEETFYIGFFSRILIYGIAAVSLD